MKWPIAFCTLGTLGSYASGSAQVRLADSAERDALRSWFVLHAEAQSEQPADDVIACASLVRFAFREALRPHTGDWAVRIPLPFTPTFPDIKAGPHRGSPSPWINRHRCHNRLATHHRPHRTSHTKGS